MWKAMEASPCPLAARDPVGGLAVYPSNTEPRQTIGIFTEEQ